MALPNETFTQPGPYGQVRSHSTWPNFPVRGVSKAGFCKGGFKKIKVTKHSADVEAEIREIERKLLRNGLK
jgi:hypothetical protein